MIIPGIALLILFGYSLIHAKDPTRMELEKWGGGYLLGIGFVTVSMLLLEVIGLPITLVNLYLIIITGIVLFNWTRLTSFSVHRLIPNLRSYLDNKHFVGCSSGNGLWFAVMGTVVLLTLSNVVIGLYWPPFAFDHITAYDLMGKVIAAEGAIDNSLFGPDGVPLEGTDKRLIYPPLVPGSFAYAYMHGLTTSKLMTVCFVVSFVICFYAQLLRASNYLNAALGTFFVLITPAFFNYSTQSTSNIPFAIYMSLGMIYLYFWISEERRQTDLLIGALFLGLSAWTRSEGVVFAGVGLLAVIVAWFRGASWKNLLWYNLGAFLLFISWFIFVQTHFNVSQTILHPYSYLDVAKAAVITGYAIDFLSSLQLFGVTCYVFLFALVLNADRLFRDRSGILLAITILSLAAITLFYYQIDYGQFSRLEGVMTFAYKRGLLCFIPLFWFYIFSSYRMRSFGEWINAKLEKY